MTLYPYYAAVQLSLDNPDDHVLPLISARFYESTQESKKEVAFRSHGEPLSLEDYRYLFRGVRCLFGNMLEWEKPGIILPEQLDHLSIQTPTVNV